MQKKTARNNKKQLNAVQNLSTANSTKTPQNYLSQKTRAKYECSKKLVEMIEQANLLPKDFNFSVDELLKTDGEFTPLHIKGLQYLLTLPKEVQAFVFSSDERIEYKKQDGYEFWLNNDGYAQDKLIDLNADEQITDELFDKLIKSGADEIADYLVDLGYYGDEYSYSKQKQKENEESHGDSIFQDSDRKSNDESDTHKIWETIVYLKALERLQSIRDFLLAIINLGGNIELKSASISENEYRIRQDNEQSVQQVMKELVAKKLQEKVLATSININKNGEIHFSISEWASALQGVDVTRIRLCEICEKIFWANRSDAFACSKKHAKTRQMRLLRANWKENRDLYLKARQKKVNNKKEKKNGTL